MPVGRTLIGGSPYLGVYLRMGERLALLPPSASKELEREIERLFGVTGVRTTVHESEILGALVALNSFGVLVGGTLDEAERAALERVAPVDEVPGRLNALGNNVLANDAGAVVHPDFSDEALERIARTLKVP
ncbi:MAG TPA: translation initiation factor IF-6, partial [Thermoplasmata archaeon]|nr:translation initiation factor IF-6 [Thermoplasmata archaeon]